MNVCNETNKKDILRCPPTKDAKQKVFFECGHNPQCAVFEIDDGCVEGNQSFVLDRVLFDTTGLNRPQVKIDFSAFIVFEAEDETGCEHEVEVDLLFKLIRTCNGVSEVLETWRYLYEIDVEKFTGELEVEMSAPFAASFCDKVCPGCCEYKVVVEGKDFEGEFDALRVIKPVLSAIVQGNC